MARKINGPIPCAYLDELRVMAATETMAAIKRRFGIKYHNSLVRILDDWEIEVPASNFLPVRRLSHFTQTDFCRHCEKPMPFTNQGGHWRSYKYCLQVCESELCAKEEEVRQLRELTGEVKREIWGRS